MSVFNEEIKESFILHIPHSSGIIPFYDSYTNLLVLTEDIIKSTDWLTDKIFNIAGITKVVFEVNRNFCDVEKFEEDELDNVGRGFYCTHSKDGVRFRNDKDKNIVLEYYYKQHHSNLTRLVKEKEKLHGVCYLIDCHSFNDEDFEDAPDICIGVNEDTPEFLKNFFVNSLTDRGFRVEINNPYVGALVPKECEKTYSIMIEINKKLYMNSGATKGCDEKVKELNSMLNEVFDTLHP